MIMKQGDAFVRSEGTVISSLSFSLTVPFLLLASDVMWWLV